MFSHVFSTGKTVLQHAVCALHRHIAVCTHIDAKNRFLMCNMHVSISRWIYRHRHSTILFNIATLSFFAQLSFSPPFAIFILTFYFFLLLHFLSAQHTKFSSLNMHNVCKFTKSYSRARGNDSCLFSSMWFFFCSFFHWRICLSLFHCSLPHNNAIVINVILLLPRLEKALDTLAVFHLKFTDCWIA